MRDFGNQAVSVAAIENARHLGTLAAPIGDVFQMWRILEFVSDVGRRAERGRSELHHGRAD